MFINRLGYLIPLFHKYVDSARAHKLHILMNSLWKLNRSILNYQKNGYTQHTHTRAHAHKPSVISVELDLENCVCISKFIALEYIRGKKLLQHLKALYGASSASVRAGSGSCMVIQHQVRFQLLFEFCVLYMFRLAVT